MHAIMADDNYLDAQVPSLQSLSLSASVEHRIEELMNLPHCTFVKLYQGGHSRSPIPNTLRVKTLTKIAKLLAELCAQLRRRR